MNATVRRVRPSSAVARGSNQRRSTVVEETTKGHVSTSMTRGKDRYFEESREVTGASRRFSEENPAAFVRVGAGLTINMQNFESLRIDVSVTIPCHPDELEAAYQEASDFVAEKVSEEETNWLGASTKRSK